ncbi:MAG: hypothetical protein AAF639_27235 [Chloroflexota bacterium]
MVTVKGFYENGRVEFLEPLPKNLRSSINVVFLDIESLFTEETTEDEPFDLALIAGETQDDDPEEDELTEEELAESDRQEAEILAQSPTFKRLIDSALNQVKQGKTRPLKEFLNELPD